MLLVRQAEPSAVLAVLGQLSVSDMLVTMAGFFLASLFIGASLLVLLPPSKHPGVTKRLFQAHLAGVLFSDITPARSGYLLTPLLLERLAGIPKEAGFAALTGMQAVSLAAKSALAALGMVFLGYKIQGSLMAGAITRYVLTGSVLLAAAAIGFAILVWTPAVERGLRQLQRFAPGVGRHRVTLRTAEGIARFRAVGQLGLRRAPLAGGFAAASTVAAGFALYAMAQAVGLGNLSALDVVMVSFVVSPLIYLPVTPGGLGVIEAGYILVLTALGQDRTSVTAFALASRALFTGTDIIGLPWLLMGMTKLQKPRTELLDA